MKLFFSQLAYFVSSSRDRNIKTLIKFFLVLVLMISVYSVTFHFLMLREGQEYSWITGIYWTLTVMSTLGFGDITFHTDIGRLFSILVLLSGMVFLLIMLPFTFIQFFYAPWLEAQARLKAPRQLPANTKGHIILTSFDHFTSHFVEKLVQHRYPYAIVISDLQHALEIHDMNYQVVVGELGDPETYQNLRVENAALVLANSGDMINTNIVATVREVSQKVSIVTNAQLDDSVDILQLAGSTHVFQFMKLLGQSLARKTLGIKTSENIVGAIDSLLIAETPVMRTPLVGKTLEESGLREATGLNIIGLWEKGSYIVPQAATRLDANKVLLLAGAEEQLKKYDQVFGSHRRYRDPVLIIGGGRVGKAAAATLEGHGIPFHIIEKSPRLVKDDERYVLGSAADIDTLNRAGIQDAPSVIITTHDDHTNIYLTIYCRKLRPDIQIISRANTERNVSKLHSAGADHVLSYESLGSAIVFNLLKPHGLQILEEGLNLFRQKVSMLFVGKALYDCHIRQLTGCNVVGVNSGGDMLVNPEPSYVFRREDELFLVGSDEAQGRYIEAFAA
jgi:Trk K+ transport system NAD-binding subunit